MHRLLLLKQLPLIPDLHETGKDSVPRQRFSLGFKSKGQCDGQSARLSKGSARTSGLLRQLCDSKIENWCLKTLIYNVKTWRSHYRLDYTYRLHTVCTALSTQHSTLRIQKRHPLCVPEQPPTEITFSHVSGGKTSFLRCQLNTQALLKLQEWKGSQNLKKVHA